jgi:hypothetical protein
MLEGLKPPHERLYPCKVAQVMQMMETSDQVILTQALEDYQTWPAKTLSNALKERKVMLADTTITKHRRNLCQCGKG